MHRTVAVKHVLMYITGNMLCSPEIIVLSFVTVSILLQFYMILCGK